MPSLRPRRTEFADGAFRGHQNPIQYTAVDAEGGLLASASFATRGRRGPHGKRAACHFTRFRETGGRVSADGRWEFPTLTVGGHDIRYVIISHAHGDHIGGAQILQERFGARVPSQR